MRIRLPIGLVAFVFLQANLPIQAVAVEIDGQEYIAGETRCRSYPYDYVGSLWPRIVKNSEGYFPGRQLGNIAQVYAACGLTANDGPPNHLTAEELALVTQNVIRQSTTRDVSADLASLQILARQTNRDDTPATEALKSAPKALAEAKASCQSVPLKGKLPPTRNQSNIGWCYAYTASDLFSFKLQKEISAVDMAINYYSWRRRHEMEPLNGGVRETDLPEGGDTFSTILAAQDSGLCLEEKLPSTGQGEFESVKDNFNLIKDLKDRLDALTEPSCVQQSELMQEYEPQLRHFFPGLNLTNVADILKVATKNDLFEKLANQACGERLSPDPKIGLLSEKNKAKMQKAIQDRLRKGEIVGIDYCSEILKDPTAACPEVNHASSVIGQRWNPRSNACEFRVRNAYGTGCGAGKYSDQYECDSASGDAWIPASVVTRGTTTVIWTTD